MKKAQAMTSCDDALERLISQFAQPLAFLRELIQNSMDASTEVVEIEVSYDRTAACCVVEVSDTGEGMDREIIETKLTRLFASTKEDDLTKIGKFGIGFVSIFAIEPKLVVLETGRAGESWRVLFHPDRSFEVRQLSEPVEGTRIKVFTPYNRLRLPRLKQDCLETITFWCKHSHVEILFNGSVLNEPFDLTLPGFKYHFKSEATEAVLAPTGEDPAFCGFYNRGLTLLEGSGSPLPKVAMKVRSIHLEHTLTRDNIIHDEGYYRLLETLEKAAYEQLPGALLEELSRSDEDTLWKQALVALDFPGRRIADLRDVRIFPGAKKTYCLRELPETVYYAREITPLWKAAEAEGEVIIFGCDSRPERLQFLRALGRRVEPLCEHFAHISIDQDPEPEEIERELLKQLGLATRDLAQKEPRLLGFEDTPSTWQLRFCVLFEEGRALVKMQALTPPKRASLGLRRDHKLWQELLHLARLQPELALALGRAQVALELEGKLALENRLLLQLTDRLQRVEAQS